MPRKPSKKSKQNWSYAEAKSNKKARKHTDRKVEKHGIDAIPIYRGFKAMQVVSPEERGLRNAK